MKYDIIIVGGGIVGLATALKLTETKPDLKIALLEKEDRVAKHQTGNNSGVIHAGVYYKPGSLKAINCRNGYKQLIEFCDKENIEYELCGKLIVATSPEELPSLENLYERSLQNGLDKIKKIAERYNLFLIEDCCDALGSTYKGQKVGTWGDFAIHSFYPAHHMTMGEGGAILTNNLQLKRTAQSIRDWGRACYCEFNERNPNGACKKRFEFEINGDKIDHRYVYSNIGYNLKPIELQCAMVLEQLKKLPTFIRQRKRNFKILYDELEHLDSIFILPRFLKDSEVSWFAFTLTIRENINIKRAELQQYLEKNKIQTRVLFAGNILKHPAYRDINHKIIGKLSNSDKIFKCLAR